MTKEWILVLDFGSQYTQLIARRIRELGVYSEIRPCTTKFSSDQLDGLKGVILSGGPSSVTDSDAPEFDVAWLGTKLPTLGVCYGMQLMAHELKGALGSGANREYGHSVITIHQSGKLFKGFESDPRTTVWMSHGDHVEKLPPGFQHLASGQGCPIAAMADEARGFYAIQFHPEVVHTPRGKDILSNFVHGICGCGDGWTAANFLEESVARIRSQVDASANVICGLSGGVDSSVAAVVVNKAIGDRLHCIFVDNGLLRKGESQEVVERLGPEGLGLRVTLVDAAQEFLSELKGVTDPEKKRKIIGRVFIEVFDREARKISNVSHLVQGTLYPDVIESISVRGPSATIKTHHNVGGLPERMKLKLIEPFRELFKDEVRLLGKGLGLSDAVVYRQPFPGPGLAVRILGEITADRIRMLQEADAIFQEEVASENLTRSLWQSFAVLLPVRSVGVMGDGRTYEETIALRAVTSEDGMTADWAYLPQDLLRRTSNRIINEVKGINRVVLDISSKPPATIEWE
jgi:GMP synthase (glutamine-hydrolysing)